MPSLRAFSLVSALGCLCAVVAPGQSLPPEMRQGLETEFHFSTEDLAQIEAGQAKARILSTRRPDDVRMVGVVLIKASTNEFLKAFRDIEHFEITKEVVRTKRSVRRLTWGSSRFSDDGFEEV